MLHCNSKTRINFPQIHSGLNSTKMSQTRVVYGVISPGREGEGVNSTIILPSPLGAMYKSRSQMRGEGLLNLSTLLNILK